METAANPQPESPNVASRPLLVAEWVIPHPQAAQAARARSRHDPVPRGPRPAQPPALSARFPPQPPPLGWSRGDRDDRSDAVGGSPSPGSARSPVPRRAGRRWRRGPARGQRSAERHGRRPATRSPWRSSAPQASFISSNSACRSVGSQLMITNSWMSMRSDGTDGLRGPGRPSNAVGRHRSAFWSIDGCVARSGRSVRLHGHGSDRFDPKTMPISPPIAIPSHGPK